MPRARHWARGLGALLLLACTASVEAGDGLHLAAGWRAVQVASWEHNRPDMLHLSADGRVLYLSFENRKPSRPSLGRIHLREHPETEYLLDGLLAADGLRLDAQGGLWLGEEVSGGRLWHVPDVASMPASQHADRQRGHASWPMLRVVEEAGRMAYEGLCFSADGRYLYLLDEWRDGALYRLDRRTRVLRVFHRRQGWLRIRQPELARLQALRLGAERFHRGEDMERLPDGTILFAETSTGVIHRLDDRGEKPQVQAFLRHPAIEHPDNLEWDRHRRWLWITDDSRLSELWVWDGEAFQRIASTRQGEITGVESADDGRIWINLQGQRKGMDQTLRLLPPSSDVLSRNTIHPFKQVLSRPSREPSRW